MNCGEEYEYALCNFLNGKRFSEIDQAHQKIVRALYPDVLDDDLISCEKVLGYLKPDIKITIRDKTFYLSVKIGTSNRLHTEKYDTFIDFLRNHGINEDSIQFFERYLFLNVRLKSNDIYGFFRKHDYEIKQLNEELSDHNFKIQMFLRCVVQGVDKEQIKCTHMLLRKEAKTYLIPIRELYKIYDKNFILGHKGICSGVFSLTAWSRNYKRLEEKGKKQCVCVAWEGFEKVTPSLKRFSV